MSGAARLRDLLASGHLIRVAGCPTGLTAVLAQQTGFDGAWVSSFETSAARALPDASLLTMTDYLQAAITVSRACDLPVIADCDTGFGSAVTVAHMVREYEAAGISAVCIEDKVFPKVNSFSDRPQQLLDADEFAHRIAIGKQVQRGPDFVLVARTETYVAGLDTDEALRRAHLYVDAGADAILVHSKASSPVQIEEFLARWQRRRPVVVVPTTYYDWHVDDMARAGVAMCIYANHGLRATVSAVRHTFEAIQSHGTTAAIEHELSSIREIFDIQRLDDWMSLER